MPSMVRPCGCQRRILGGAREFAVQRQDVDAVRGSRRNQRTLRAADLGGPRQEAQDIAVVLFECATHDLCHLQLQM
jgi:hypothetical protein